MSVLRIVHQVASHLHRTTASNVTYNSIICHQNYQMWAKNNPHWVQESNQNAMIVWCGIHNRRVIGPYFIEETVNTASYLRFLEIHLSIILNNMPSTEAEVSLST
ncbi:hypothetical protein WN51_07130 [Melipona quadrifasciata]|uniref:Uncharacterized protein n=1 Tax=Melipona quadrifasciata TaxID=166423 RepID=A0A0M8ZQM7_9HYME|nr:hypothetical protein WN51_07130 [Melipona quadrifasciata]